MGGGSGGVGKAREAALRKALLTEDQRFNVMTPSRGATGTRATERRGHRERSNGEKPKRTERGKQAERDHRAT